MYLILKCTNMNTDENEIPCVYIEFTDMPLKQRLHHHLYHSQLEKPKELIHKAIKALGTKNFQWEVIDTCEDLSEAKEMAKYYQTDYKADVIGYNRPIDGENVGEKNPRFGDHRTWEELHGKERAEEMKANLSVKLKANPMVAEHMRRRREVWNPMDNPATREKLRQSHLGTKNHMAVWDYLLTKENGEVIKIECLREFCKNNKGFTRSRILSALQYGKKYKGMTVQKIPKVKEE